MPVPHSLQIGYKEKADRDTSDTLKCEARKKRNRNDLDLKWVY